MTGGLDAGQLRDRAIRPTLRALDAWSPSAEALLLGTAAQESGLRWLAQLGGGPALGLYQMEPATHDDIWANYLAYRPELRGKVEALLAPAPASHLQLVTNLAYATAMCRVHYRRVAAPLPAADDIAGLAAYWKRHYNTPLGKGTEAEFAESWHRLVAFA